MDKGWGILPVVKETRVVLIKDATESMTVLHWEESALGTRGRTALMQRDDKRA